MFPMLSVRKQGSLILKLRNIHGGRGAATSARLSPMCMTPLHAEALKTARSRAYLHKLARGCFTSRLQTLLRGYRRQPNQTVHQPH